VEPSEYRLGGAVGVEVGAEPFERDGHVRAAIVALAPGPLLPRDLALSVGDKFAKLQSRRLARCRQRRVGQRLRSVVVLIGQRELNGVLSRLDQRLHFSRGSHAAGQRLNHRHLNRRRIHLEVASQQIDRLHHLFRVARLLGQFGRPPQGHKPVRRLRGRLSTDLD